MAWEAAAVFPDPDEGGARLIWCLRRRSSDVRCVLNASTLPVEVRILQDRDVVLTEVFPAEELALSWARLYGERLKQQGWFERPTWTNPLREDHGRDAPENDRNDRGEG